LLLSKLTAREEAYIRRRAAQEGEDEQALVARLMSGLLANESEEPETAEVIGRSMADRFAGRVGVVAGSGEAYSEAGGQRFAEHLVRKHLDTEDRP
jgi:hypothetical protein